MGVRRWTLGRIAMALAAMSASGAGRADDRADDVGPMLSRYCLGCHSGAEPKGGLGPDRFVGAPDDRGPSAWERIVAQLEAAAMPPEGRPQPSAAEAARIGRWASDGMARALARVRPGPGRVTMRRLNRAGYNRAPAGWRPGSAGSTAASSTST